MISNGSRTSALKVRFGRRGREPWRDPSESPEPTPGDDAPATRATSTAEAERAVTEAAPSSASQSPANSSSDSGSSGLCPLTPNLAQLASSDHAAVFHRFYAAASVCSPMEIDDDPSISAHPSAHRVRSVPTRSALSSSSFTRPWSSVSATHTSRASCLLQYAPATSLTSPRRRTRRRRRARQLRRPRVRLPRGWQGWRGKRGRRS